MQTKIALLNVSKEDVKKVVIAYEPVWAIGTGKTATNEQADEVCGIIREAIEKLYDKETADEIRILYGGSMNAKNAADLLKQPNIDGGLIGGASSVAGVIPSIADGSFEDIESSAAYIGSMSVGYVLTFVITYAINIFTVNIINIQ